MPNRIIKESTFTSDKISALSDFEFRLWVGLITQADDAGRGDARPAIIKGRVFPLRERVTAKDIQAALDTLAATGCITLYMADGHPYFYFPSWEDHQRVRNAIPKFPDPQSGHILPAGAIPPQSAATCGDLRRSTANGGEVPQSAAQSNPIQSESNPNPNPNKGAKRADRTETEKTDFEKALDDFAAARKAMKKPLTDKARELTISKLQELAPGDETQQIAIINQSIQRGWQGVFPLKDDDTAQPSKSKGPAMKTPYDKLPPKSTDGDDLERLAMMLGVDNEQARAVQRLS